MVNRGIPAFYNPKLDNPSAEENFLLKQRMRLIAKINKIKTTAQAGNYIHQLQLERWTKKLAINEKKLGIKQ